MSQNLLSIAKKLSAINRKCYVVGSYCIHKIQEIPFDGDIDLTTDATPEEITKVLTTVGEIGKKYGTLIIKEWTETFEITTFRKDIWSVNHRKPIEVIFTKNLEEDAKRRDFTINAIYYDILADVFLDPTGGISDLKNQILRFVWDINFRLDEDILRLMRYVRFLYKYDLKPANSSYSRIIKKRTIELKHIAIERIRQEFDKILVHSSNIKALKFLKIIWFFTLFLPEVDNLENTIGWPQHHLEWNVWKHTLLVLKKLNKFLYTNIIPNSSSVILSATKDPLHKNRLQGILHCAPLHSEWHSLITVLYWSALLHDIGKTPTVTKDENGNTHYFNHERIGAEMFLDIAKRWKFSIIQTKNIHWLIKEHLLPYKIPEMRNIKKNSLMLHPLFPTLIILSLADSRGKKPKYIFNYKKIFADYKNFLERYNKTKFFNWADILEKYPELTWAEIWIRLKSLNDQILAKI